MLVILIYQDLAVATNQRTRNRHHWFTLASGSWSYPISSSIQIDQVSLALGCGTASDPDLSIGKPLQSLLDESAAYRKYYLREDKDHLINYAHNRLKLD